jgi:hypothetical protein
MRVHVTLKRSTIADSDAKSYALRELLDTGLRDIDESRFRRFGVASGEIADEKRVDLEQLEVVEAVEPDRFVSVGSRE